MGIAALCTNCPNLEYVDLTGCFRLNITFQRHVSDLSKLLHFNASGCNQATSEAFAALAEGCPLIEDLNLSDCNLGVNNASLVAFAKSCRNLKTLILARCDNVRGHGMKAIACLCTKLVKLGASFVFFLI